ncbi:MAG TPA: glycosyltransferase [Candidatus Saccharibacteria bacterium]|nr:glycosyltransferase [Candidatus Saccharibacteria bacterium]
MRVLSVGGGSGGHVTPVLAVINELAKLDSHLDVLFVTDKAFLEQSTGLMQHAVVPVAVRTIVAGKLRRYKDVPLHKQLLHWPTVSKNVVDSGKVFVGILQSLWLLIRYRPDVVFAKGGYVSLPVGLAARFLRVPLVVHDSDARPGLTNRILARYATQIATGAPVEYYPAYKGVPITYVGVPIDSNYHPFTAQEQRQAKAAIGIVDCDKPLVVVTGGGLGSRDINRAILSVADQLLDDNLAVYHIAGKKHAAEVEAAAPAHPDYHVIPFVYKDMMTVLGAADVVVSRASATFLQEIAALHKPAVIVPSSSLGDQLKNAEAIRQDAAAIVMSDEELADDPQSLLDIIVKITTDSQLNSLLSEAIGRRAMPAAAADTAKIILKAKKG